MKYQGTILNALETGMKTTINQYNQRNLELFHLSKSFGQYVVKLNE